MAESQESQEMAHFPPGAAAPTAADRLRSPEHIAKLNEARKAFYEKPLEERREIIAKRRADKEAKRLAREAKKAAKNGNGHAAPATEPGPITPRHSDDAPPTVRSARGSMVPDSAVPVRPRAGVGQLRGLLDVCAAMPDLGDGTCFIQVTRIKPTVAWNIPCAGVQKPIWDVIDDAEFAQLYGGAEYSLRGYALKEGNKTRALTEPVTYKVSGAPNFDSALTEDDTMMRPNPDRPPPNGHGGFQRRPGIVTPQTANAEAQMHSRSLDHRERADDLREQRRREEKREEQEAAQARRENELETARLIESGKEKEMERLQRIHERELQLAQSRGSELVEVLKSVKPDGDTQGLIRQHAAELRQITEGHKEELLRLTEQHRQEIQRLTDNHSTALHRVEDQARIERERADVLIREADKRASDAVKEAERRAAEQIREVERRSDARVADVQAQAQGNYNELRTRSEERIRDQNDSWQRRFDDQRANAERELRAKESEINLMRSNLEGNMQVVLAQKDGEIKRLQHDLREWKEEAEKNKDWLGRMGEFEKTAEAMGFSKGTGGEGEDEDFKTFALKALVTAGTRLPELVQSTGELISKVRNPAAPPDATRSQARVGIPRGHMPPAPRAMGLPPVPVQPLAFATEEGGYVPPRDLQPPRPFGPPPAMAQAQALPALEQMAPPPMPQQMSLPLPEPQQPQQPLPLPPQQALPIPQPAPVQAPPAAVPSVAAPAPAAPAATAAPPAVGPPSVPPAAAPSASDLDAMTATVLERFTPMLAMQFQQRTPPAAVAQQIIDENGIELAAFAMSTVSAEQIIRHILSNPGQHSVLTTRNGQKFLRDIWSAAEKAVAGDGAQQQQ